MDLRRKAAIASGFTFLEVMVALVILGSALTIILGLQTSLIESTVLKRQQREALGFAREILSAVEARESAGDPLETGSYTGTPREIMSGLLPGSSDETQAEPQVASADFRAELVVEYWGIPNIDPRALKRVQLTISWGERTPEQLQLFLFIPFDEDQVSEDTSGEDDVD